MPMHVHAQMLLGMVVVQLMFSALPVMVWVLSALAAKQDDTVAWLWFSEGSAH